MDTSLSKEDIISNMNKKTNKIHGPKIIHVIKNIIGF